MIKHLFAEVTSGQDATGDCGSLVHYALVMALVGSAFLIFLYLWRKDKLDMDEEPKHKMLNEDSKEPTSHGK